MVRSEVHLIERDYPIIILKGNVYIDRKHISDTNKSFGMNFQTRAYDIEPTILAQTIVDIIEHYKPDFPNYILLKMEIEEKLTNDLVQAYIKYKSSPNKTFSEGLNDKEKDLIRRNYWLRKIL